MIVHRYGFLETVVHEAQHVAWPFKVMNMLLSRPCHMSPLRADQSAQAAELRAPC